jgi:CRISPR system Cascade subunit CasD
MANTLFLRLEGALQSWGERGRWSIRDTAPEPTKSGVVGLLGCALGWADDQRLLGLSQAIQLGVRCDQPGSRLVDYHTVVGGVMAAERRIKINANTKEPETVVSERAYLCDASFLAAVRSDAGWIERLAEAVKTPVWPVYLGRKSCPPGLPLFEGVGEYASLREALLAPAIHCAAAGPVRVRLVIEAPPGQGFTRNDELDSHSRRTYLPRTVRAFTSEFNALLKEV